MKHGTAKKEPQYSPAPAHLSEASRALWTKLGPLFCQSIGRRELLAAALEARDRCSAAREQIAIDGMTTNGKGLAHVHPLLRIEKDARQQFVSVLHTLGLNWRDDEPDEEL